MNFCCKSFAVDQPQASLCIDESNENTVVMHEVKNLTNQINSLNAGIKEFVLPGRQDTNPLKGASIALVIATVAQRKFARAGSISNCNTV